MSGTYFGGVVRGTDFDLSLVRKLGGLSEYQYSSISIGKQKRKSPIAEKVLTKKQIERICDDYSYGFNELFLYEEKYAMHGVNHGIVEYIRLTPTVVNTLNRRAVPERKGIRAEGYAVITDRLNHKDYYATLTEAKQKAKERFLMYGEPMKICRTFKDDRKRVVDMVEEYKVIGVELGRLKSKPKSMSKSHIVKPVYLYTITGFAIDPEYEYMEDIPTYGFGEMDHSLAAKFEDKTTEEIIEIIEHEIADGFFDSLFEMNKEEVEQYVEASLQSDLVDECTVMSDYDLINSRVAYKSVAGVRLNDLAREVIETQGAVDGYRQIMDAYLHNDFKFINEVIVIFDHDDMSIDEIYASMPQEIEGSIKLPKNILEEYIRNDSVPFGIFWSVSDNGNYLAIDNTSGEDWFIVEYEKFDGLRNSVRQARDLEANRLLYDKLNEIQTLCQVERYTTERRENELHMLMPVTHCDCEHYFEEYNIQQEQMNGLSYNVINLTRLIDSSITQRDHGLDDKQLLEQKIDNVLANTTAGAYAKIMFDHRKNEYNLFRELEKYHDKKKYDHDLSHSGDGIYIKHTGVKLQNLELQQEKNAHEMVR